MTAKSILLTEDEVQEILDAPTNGTLELVRVVRPQPPKYLDWVGWEIGGGKDEGKATWAIDNGRGVIKNVLVIKPPYAAGDDLWGREAWTESSWTPFKPSEMPETTNVIYKASPLRKDWNIRGVAWEDAWRWRPSVHMPRWASRIALRVKDVVTYREYVGKSPVEIKWVWGIYVEVVK